MRENGNDKGKREAGADRTRRLATGEERKCAAGREKNRAEGALAGVKERAENFRGETAGQCLEGMVGMSRERRDFGERLDKGRKRRGEKGLFWGGACYGILKGNGGTKRCGP